MSQIKLSLLKKAFSVLFLFLWRKERFTILKNWKGATIEMVDTKDCFHCHANKNKTTKKEKLILKKINKDDTSSGFLLCVVTQTDICFERRLQSPV